MLGGEIHITVSYHLSTTCCVSHHAAPQALALAADDLKHPSSQCGGRTERPDTAEEQHHRLLRGILGVLAGGAEHASEPADVRMSLGKQLLKGVGIPSLGAQDGFI